MKPIVPLAVLCAAFCFSVSASASIVEDDARLAVIDQEMNCVSNHVKQGVDWSDVCYTSDSKDRLITKTMDQMIDEHSAAAQEMATETVDSVSEAHGQYADSIKSMDSVVEEHGTVADTENPNQPAAETNLDSSRAQPSQYVQYAANNTAAYESADFTPQGALDAPRHSLTDRLDNQNKAEIGLEYNWQSYKEPIFDLTVDGSMYGGYAAYTARPARSDGLYDDIIDMYKADLRVTYGRKQYESVSGQIDDIPDWLFEGRLTAGKDFKVFSDSRLTPYLGFGYRYLNDDSSGKTTASGAAGYERESRYFYLPLGAEFTTQLADGWLVSPTVEYDLFISGTQNSHLSDVSAALPDVKNKQRHGFGLRGSLKIVKENKPVNFVFEPYVRYWHIEDSDETTAAGPGAIVTGLEPENKTTEYGVRVGAEF